LKRSAHSSINLHAFRAAYQAKEIYESGTITYPLAKRERLLDIKLGRLDYKTEVAPALEELVEEIDALSKLSNLPDKVDTEYWDNFILKTYDRYYKLNHIIKVPNGTKLRSAEWLMDMYDG